MDDYNFLDQYQTTFGEFGGFNYVDELTPALVSEIGEKEDSQQQQHHHQSSSDSHTWSPSTFINGSSLEICENRIERPSKITKPTTQNDSVLEEASPKASLSSHTSSEGSPPQQLNENPENNSDGKDEVVSNGDLGFIPSNVNKSNAPKVGQKRSNAVVRTSLEAQDRVMAERKRREKLSQRFIALSAIIPDLKKMDKASVLGDAIKYLKHLQEHVKLLQEQITKKSEESVVFVNNSQLSGDDDTSSCDENFDGRRKKALPEIEARISEKNVLIRVHCEKQKGFAVKLLSEIEKNHLSVVNSSFLPFGQYTIDITVVAQMDAEFCMTVKDLVRNLRTACLKFNV
ncbi:basic helix-loop-helix (bHLH) DNA-binding superfamily protein [Actinidia rufa]|uniref:Basic helix-loop-helix (BHLH) DNA-binding superfamily protein n=1 Tax=Actinidia rufa TaxID=165716 RepID=A0A7J0H6X5_9ERIC|nr:basic helix-loop-helix (bHLH) DNA-binding superfamily protein [Actinidia rufa]